MSKFDTSEEYDLEIDEFKKTDPVHADLFNLKFVKLIRSIAFNRRKTEEIHSSISKIDTSFIDRTYPIGSIYLSVNETNPAKYFGGTWVAWGSGRVPVGINASDENFNAVEKTGGSAAVSLSTEHMPSHTHAIGAHSHGLNAHKHSFTTGNQSAGHTHSISITSGTQSANHTHSIPALSGTAASAGQHSHRIYVRKDNSAGGGTDRVGTDALHAEVRASSILADGAHTHSVTTNAATSGGNSANHTHAVSGATGGISANHNHSGTTGAASGNTANSSQFNSGSSGSGTAHSNLQPYITCYMWKRTA